MKRLMLTLAIVSSSFALEARAGDAGGFSIACPATALPRHADVVRLYDEHNLGKVYELRQRLRTLARLECRSGAGRVDIVAAPAQPLATSIALARH